MNWKWRNLEALSRVKFSSRRVLKLGRVTPLKDTGQSTPSKLGGKSDVRRSFIGNCQSSGREKNYLSPSLSLSLTLIYCLPFVTMHLLHIMFMHYFLISLSVFNDISINFWGGQIFSNLYTMALVNKILASNSNFYSRSKILILRRFCSL